MYFFEAGTSEKERKLFEGGMGEGGGQVFPEYRHFFRQVCEINFILFILEETFH